MLNDLRYEGLIFFLRILLVQNAVLLMMQTDTSKTIRACGKTIRIIEIGGIGKALIGKRYARAVIHSGAAFVNKFGVIAKTVVIV